MNEALARIDIALAPAVVSETATPPASPAKGANYLAGNGATGEFAGQEGAIANWDGQQWSFLNPTPGMVVKDLGTGTFVQYANGWTRVSAPELASTGTTVDFEAREAIGALITALKAFGVFS